MSGPLDRIDPPRQDVPSDYTSRISTNLSGWRERVVRVPWLAIWINGMMYVMLILTGLEQLPFKLDPLVLATLVGATAGASAPYHIRLAINIIRGKEE